VLAAGAIGWAAEHGSDRRVLTAFITFCVGQLIVFGIGVPWLMVAVDLSPGDAVYNGFTLFIAGGLMKAAAAGLLTPVAWHFVRRVDKR
jgi:biotin transport system substrate-specific component